MSAAPNAAPEAEPGQGGEEHPLVAADGIRFVTANASEEERAAVLAVLAQARAEETERVRRVERRERAPWARSQRTPEGIAEYLS